jgi:hypothetical protein
MVVIKEQPEDPTHFDESQRQKENTAPPKTVQPDHAK